MRPHKLLLTNIGPFVGTHTIDFSALDNIYLITGKTGSGKTTILDAMTYALYGTLPGVRSDIDKKFLRSQFVSDTEPSSIIFTFTVLGTTYKVERNLPYTKTTNRGTTKTENESAILYKITEPRMQNEGELFSGLENEKVIENMKKSTDEHIKKLLSLTIDEFSRIVLLPQGEFANFLRQNTTDRKKILSKLFPTEQFSAIIKKAKIESDTKRVRLEEINRRISHLQESFNPETAEAEIKTLEKTQKKDSKRITVLQKTADELIKEVERLTNLAEKQKNYKNIQEQYSVLIHKENEVNNHKKKVIRAKEANTIMPLVRSYEHYNTEFLKYTKEFNSSRIKLEHITKEYINLEAQEKECESWKVRLVTIESHLNDLKKCLELEKIITKDSINLSSKEKELKIKSKQVLELQSTCATMKEIIAKEEENQLLAETHNHNLNRLLYSLLLVDNGIIDLQVQAETKHLEDERAILDKLKEKNEEYKRKNLAISLLEQLKEGCPCPVCGATEHPHIINKDEVQDPITEKILDQEKIIANLEHLTKKTHNAKISIETKLSMNALSFDRDTIEKPQCTTREDYDELKDILENERIKQIEAIQIVEKALTEIKKSRKKYDEYQEILSPLKDTINTLSSTINGLTLVVSNNKKLQDNYLQTVTLEKDDDVQTAITKLSSEKLQLMETIDTYTKHKKTIVEELTRTTEQKNMLEKLLKENTEYKEQSYLELVTTLHHSSFGENEDTVAQVKSESMSEAELSNITKMIENYNNEKLRLQTLQESLEKDLQNKEVDIERSQHETQKKLSVTKEEQTSLQENIRHTIGKISKLNDNLKMYNDETKTLRELKADFEIYTTLHKVINGENAKKIPLDVWVLSMHLQEITILANKRLKSMSNERYQLHLKTEEFSGGGFKGLDLEIFDEFTGKLRPTSSLSGGETFMASISLALAISDLVQQQNGGIQLDSMFIDEGFGSLDPESLEKALSILDEIRETRSIGLISHVEILQTRIASQITVNKTSFGSTVDLNYSNL